VFVDDDSDLAEALGEALLLEGIALHSADAADQAVALASTVGPLLILVDYQLPGVDVGELVSRLRAVSTAPILLCTGMDDASVLSREAGADGFLTKPFSIEELLRLAKPGGHPAATP
jgi:DNA-binding response OmpR family regulator